MELSVQFSIVTISSTDLHFRYKSNCHGIVICIKFVCAVSDLRDEMGGESEHTTYFRQHRSWQERRQRALDKWQLQRSDIFTKLIKNLVPPDHVSCSICGEDAIIRLVQLFIIVLYIVLLL